MDERYLTIIINAIEEYNKFRGVEAEAKLLKTHDNSVYISIKGSFKCSCGYYDWFDDLIYLLYEKGVKAEIIKILEEGDGGVGIYRILI